METYRGWSLVEGKLHSAYVGPNQSTLWETTTLTAICPHGCDPAECLERHPACTCGIYSLKSLKALAEQYPGMDIYGVVYNHGVVFEGARGLRSEKVTIRALYTSDFVTGTLLAKNYPGVAILLPPPEITEIRPRQKSLDNWQQQILRTRMRAQERASAVEMAKIKYPQGPTVEKTRLMGLLKGANREKIIEFAKEYASTDEWAARNWQGHIEKHTKKARPGDMVFEANDDTHPYVFIGSTRPNPYTSMRFLFDRNGILVKRPNIRRWDEEPDLLEARKQAVEEWE